MEIEDSVQKLQEAAKEPNLTVVLQVPAAQLGGYVTDTQKAANHFVVTVLDYEKKRAALAKELAALPEFHAAATYVAQYLGLKE